MPENLLYLCPADFDRAPVERSTLIASLRQARFIAEEMTFTDETHYHPGEQFLSLITFLGCSPVIDMGAPGKTGEGFTHIEIEGPHDSPRFVSGNNLKIPRCPFCGHRFEKWQQLVESPALNTFNCPDCSKQLTAPQLRWRKCAGFGRLFIKVWGIFESEAVPSPELLALLEQASGSAWLYFYVRYQD
jgi:hypothetical protein